MKYDLKKILKQKQNDRRFQVAGAILAIGLAVFTFLMSLFLLGIVHAVSTIYWALRKDAPRTMGRRVIEIVNIVTLILFLGGLLADFATGYRGDATGLLFICLLCIGPVLGYAYFAVTNAEIKYLHQLIGKEQQDAPDTWPPVLPA